MAEGYEWIIELGVSCNRKRGDKKPSSSGTSIRMSRLSFFVDRFESPKQWWSSPDESVKTKVFFLLSRGRSFAPSPQATLIRPLHPEHVSRP